MASNQLERELCSYCFHVKIIKKLLSDTKQVFTNINGASCFESANYLSTLSNGMTYDGNGPGVGSDTYSSLRTTEQVSSPNEWSLISCDINFKVNTDISTTEEDCLKLLFRNPPIYFIISASPEKRCKIINNILKQDLLNLSDPDKLWRTLLLKFSMKCKSEKIESECIPFHQDSHNFSFSKSFNIRSLQRNGAFNEEDVLVNLGVSDQKQCYTEIHHNSQLLLSGLNVVVPEVRPLNPGHWHRLFSFCMSNINPLFIFHMDSDSFSTEELELVDFLRSQLSHLSILFVKGPPCAPVASSASGDLNQVEDKISNLSQLCLLLNFSEAHQNESQTPEPSLESSSLIGPSCHLEMAEDFASLPDHLLSFTMKVHNARILSAVETMISIHLRCLNSMINLAFNMARGTVRVPARIKFARKKEEELFKTLMEIAVLKQDEVKKMICETVMGKKEELIEEAAKCEITNIELSDDGSVRSSKDLKACSCQIEDFVLTSLNTHIAGKLVSSIDVLRESFTGLLSRCLASLEEMDMDLEPGASKTSKALKEMISAAYKVNITPQSNESLVKSFIEKIKQMFNNMLSRSQMKVDSEWKKKIAGDMLSTLTENRCQKLAKGICNQIKERIKRSHQAFESSLKLLEAKHSGRIERTEEHRLRVRKEFAPRVARLSLESRSLRDLILHGKPKVGNMIGNGQYGVVFACEPWNGPGPCAVKILVPNDDKHWNDLAMEFYYTMNIPSHDRIVTLRGSVIDYSYNSGGSGPAVMLIMDRMPMDLHAAIEKKLTWIDRLQVSIDIIEGIRYLHSQGLVHRDIKLKNVLLDDSNRGKLTDLGFCKPEALITYSVVGTPIHMAPELVSGRYDHSVDVYAFGVLFWFICSGSVSLPPQFKECPSKEVLWTNVKRGVRPEKPRDIDPECWDLILKCWHSDPDKRPLVGEIEDSLRSIYDRVVKSLPPGQSRQPRPVQVYAASDNFPFLSDTDEFGVLTVPGGRAYNDL